MPKRKASGLPDGVEPEAVDGELEGTDGEQTPEEIYDENLNRLRMAQAVAGRLWETPKPAPELVFGVSEILAAMGDPTDDLAEMAISAGKRTVERLCPGALAAPDSVFAVVKILLGGDENAQAHLDAAKGTAAALFGSQFPTLPLDLIVDVYEEIYGPDEE